MKELPQWGQQFKVFEAMESILSTVSFSLTDFLPSEVTDQKPEQEEEPEDDKQRLICFNDDANDHQPQQNDPQPNSPLFNEATYTQDRINPDLLIRDAPSPNSTPITLLLGRPSTSSDLVLPGVTSPRDIIPLHKIKIKRKRSGRGVKSVLLTSTPHKKHLEDLQKEKENKKTGKRSEERNTG